MAGTISRTEAQAIRNQLRLRFNTLFNTYEVYTTVHGSGVFRWFKITDETAQWYKEHFGLKVDSYLQASLRTGGLLEVSHSSPPSTMETA
jgi:hypothetical protein